MRLGWTNLGWVLGLACAFGLGAVLSAPPIDAAPRKPKKPTDVNVVASVPLDVTVANPLQATLATLPPITIASVPNTTHVGRPPDDLVTLSLITPTTAPTFVRSREDGTQEAAEYVVPAGSHLVVTDVDWIVNGNLNYFHTTLSLFVEKAASRCRVAVLSSPTSNVATAGGGSQVSTYGTTGINTGFVVGAGARVVLDLRDSKNVVSGGAALQPFTDTDTVVILRGYLARD